MHPVVAAYGPIVRTMFPELRTGRSVANGCFRQHAIHFLTAAWESGDRSCAHILDVDGCRAGTTPTLRSGVLTELGRIAYEYSADYMLACARLLPAALPDGEAVRRLRIVRKAPDSAPPAEAGELAERIEQTIASYLDGRGCANPKSLVLAALALARSAIEVA